MDERWMVKGLLTENDAKAIVSHYPTNFYCKIMDYLTGPILPAIGKVLNVIQTLFKNIEEPSYLKIESNNKGYDWHVDTGNNNHMAWCNYGCSILLTNDFEGGLLEYKDGLAYKHYLDMLIHKSNVPHRISEAIGNKRYVLLFFLKAKLGNIDQLAGVTSIRG
jgi:hypothetical protein